MGAPIVGADVKLLLANADMHARVHAEALKTADALQAWRDDINWLAGQKVPVTYMAVLAILLSARAMHPADALCVRDIKFGTSDLGYSASSIGSVVAAFAKEHGIDLRATSSQPMNNQPFTFKDRFDRDTSVKSTLAPQWSRFNDIVDQVEALSSDEAREVLALLMTMRRSTAALSVTLPQVEGISHFREAAALLSAFVLAESDSGKVGQAFVAALLDCLYGADNVSQGNAQDPDASKVGDVHVMREGSTWLWVEVKQKVVGTGEIVGFMQKVSAAGGDRMLYFALSNGAYMGNINEASLAKEKDKLLCTLDMHVTPLAAIEAVMAFAPGSFGEIGARLVERTYARLQEAGANASVLETFLASVAEPMAAGSDL